VPEGATDEAPAPGVLAVHGYINQNETHASFAIEFARRGYGVLALDQTGHGYSDPPAFANGFGGPDALAYLRSLPFVDPDNIGLEGHSMGGWAVLAAAATYPDGYRSLVLEGSSTGDPFAPEGTEEYPRDLAVVFSEYDEFSELMWSVPVASAVNGSEKLQAVFGTDQPVEEGRIYGDLDAGTARVLFTPPVHPGDHISTVAIGHALDWMERTLDGGQPLPTSNQIWYWREIGTLLALIGGVLIMFPVGGMLVRGSGAAAVVGRTEREAVGARGPVWWFTALLGAALPILLYYPLNLFGQEAITPSALLPQQITNGIVVWAVAVGLVTLAIFLIGHALTRRSTGATMADTDWVVAWRASRGRRAWRCSWSARPTCC
jgi:pimeloyl-ACP methyl ester carboxylesterase